VAYVGNRGHHLPDTALAWNEPSAKTFFNALNANPGINGFNDYVFCPTKGQPDNRTRRCGVHLPVQTISLAPRWNHSRLIRK